MIKDEKSGQQLMTLQTPVLSRALEEDYLDFVKKRFGIIINSGHKDLAKVIASDCQKYSITPDMLLDKFKNSADESEVLNELVSAITIGETYFFRDKNQVKLLSQVVLPEIINTKIDKNEKSLRIWSAGCSSGEEIYTIIMLIKDIIANIDDWQCFFLATDINIDVLKKGMSGRYSEWSMRSIPQIYLDKYFTKVKNTFQLSDDIKKLVSFDYLNLNSDIYPSLMTGTMMHDLIICRNVLIYFDTDHTMKIINRLSRCVNNNGYIMLGASDPIAMLDTNLKAAHDCPSLFTVKSVTKKVAEIPKVECKTRDVSSKVMTDEKINYLAKLKMWDEILDATKVKTQQSELSVSAMTAKAMALANTGKINDAIKVCEECIKKDKMNKEAYFIYALALSEARQWKDAEAAFRKALYIDPEFLLCRFQFGMFLIRHNKVDEGVRALKNVIKLAGKFPESDAVTDANNISYKDLITTLSNEIDLHQ